MLLQVREASVKFAKAIGGATSGTVPMLGVFQEAVVQVVQGFPDMSDYRPFGRCAELQMMLCNAEGLQSI